MIKVKNNELKKGDYFIQIAKSNSEYKGCEILGYCSCDDMCIFEEYQFKKSKHHDKEIKGSFNTYALDDDDLWELFKLDEKEIGIYQAKLVVKKL